MIRDGKIRRSKYTANHASTTHVTLPLQVFHTVAGMQTRVVNVTRRTQPHLDQRLLRRARAPH